MALQSIWICPCIALMKALLFPMLSCMATYAVPKLETASVRDAVDALSSRAFMLQPFCKAGVAVKDAMLTAVSQEAWNVAKSIVLVGLLLHIVQALYSSTKRPMQKMTQIPMSTIIVGDGMLGNPCDGCHSKVMVVRLALQLSADVRPYFMTNQANILHKTEMGFSIQIYL